MIYKVIPTFGQITSSLNSVNTFTSYPQPYPGNNDRLSFMIVWQMTNLMISLRWSDNANLAVPALLSMRHSSLCSAVPDILQLLLQ